MNKSLVASALFLAGISSTYAATAIHNVTGSSFGTVIFADSKTHTFDDVFQVNFATPTSVTGVISQLNIFSGDTINLTGNLYSGVYGSSGTTNLGLAFNNVSSFSGSTSLPTGSYFLQITGSGTGVLPAYSIGASIAAVPEPETYAMMLAGLGLVGAIARRRKEKLETQTVVTA